MTAGAERRTADRPAKETRHQARQAALQMLYQWEVGRLSMFEVRQTFWTHSADAGEPLSEDLRAFAWSAPMRDLAAKVGMSDVGLKKLLAARGVSAPPQGYWNKARAGKPVPKCRPVPARRPGEIGRIRLDRRFASVLPAAEPTSSSGPFASRVVPEDLEALRAQELQAIGKVAVRKTLDRLHAGLSDLLRKEERRREKAASDRWAWDLPKFDGPLDKRRLRILNAIFLALSKRDHWGEAFERDGEIHATAIVGDTRVGIDVAIVGPHMTVIRQGRQLPSPDLPAKTPLAVRVRSGWDGDLTEEWKDDRSGTVESRITEITAGLIVAGERQFRIGLRRAEEFREQQRLREVALRREQAEARNRERLKNLHRSGELLRQANDLQALIAQVREVVAAGTTAIEAATLADWERWALAEADRTDPILSGQVLTHIDGSSGDQVTHPSRAAQERG